jgi:hypothetical protein
VNGSGTTRRALEGPAVALGVLLGFLLLGCTTFRVLDPHAPVVLEEGEGILVVHIRTQVKLHSVKISGALIHDAGTELPAGEHFTLLAATSGDYRWHRLERVFAPVTYHYEPPKDEGEWDFTVEAGKINYPGLLVVEGVEGHSSLAVRAINQSAMAFFDLERRHPGLIEQFPMRWAGSPRDDFLERYLEAREERSPADGQEP